MTYTKDNIRPSRETIGERSTTHGRSRSPEYYVWKTMRSRCFNPNNKSFYRYGGRGITICKQWNSFATFIADMGERPDGMTLERKDNDGNYCPENCVWDTRQVQSNNRRSNKNVTYNGRTQNIMQWSKEVGIKAPTLLLRLKLGWNAHQILTTPVTDKSRNPKTDAITYQGCTQTLTEWAVQLNIKRLILYKRLFVHGWSVEKSLITPPKD